MVSYVSGILVCYPNQKVLSKFDIKKNKIMFFTWNSHFVFGGKSIGSNEQLCASRNRKILLCWSGQSLLWHNQSCGLGLVLHIAYVIRVYQTEPRQPGV